MSESGGTVPLKRSADEDIRALLNHEEVGNMNEKIPFPSEEKNVETLLNAEKSTKNNTYDKIPREVHEMIVERCTKETRKALKLSSKYNWLLVEETKLQILRVLFITKNENVYLMSGRKVVTSRGPYPEIENYEFWEHHESFGELQTSLTDLLKPIHSIGMLEMKDMDSVVTLENWNNGFLQKARVEHVTLENQEQMRKVLCQLEPIFLHTVDLVSNEGDTTVFDLPQVIHAESVHIDTSIEENQLLNLNARQYYFDRVLPFSLKRFIDKCASTAHLTFPTILADEKVVMESIKQQFPRQIDNCVLFETQQPDMYFKLSFENSDFVKGNVGFSSERCASSMLYRHQPVLRTVSVLDISFCPSNNCWKIIIERTMQSVYSYKVQSIEEASEKMNEVLENIDAIKNITMKINQSSDGSNDRPVGKFHWKPRKEPLLVKALTVEGNHSVTSVHDLLSLINPDYLVDLEIISNETECILYDMPQLCKAQKIFVTGSILQDEQLLKINAIEFKSLNPSADKSHNGSLTANGINQFLKKRLLMLSQRNSIFSKFELANISPTIGQEEVLSGLDIFSRQISENKTKVHFATSGEELFFEVVFSDGSISGKMVLKIGQTEYMDI